MNERSRWPEKMDNMGELRPISSSNFGPADHPKPSGFQAIERSKTQLRIS